MRDDGKLEAEEHDFRQLYAENETRIEATRARLAGDMPSYMRTAEERHLQALISSADRIKRAMALKGWRI